MIEYEEEVLKVASKPAPDKSKAEKDARIHQKTTEIENHSKETAPTKATAKDDASLSKTKKKSEVGEIQKKDLTRLRSSMTLFLPRKV